MNTPHFDAWIFNGRSTRGGHVEVAVRGQELLLRSPTRGAMRKVPARWVRLSEPLLHAPRRAWLPKGFSLEVADGAGFSRALKDAGWKEPLTVCLASRWPLSLAALGTTVALLIAFYVVGLPILARCAAAITPVAFEKELGDEVLEYLDAEELQASGLSAAECETIASRFAEAAARLDPKVDCRLEFRSIPGIAGINAFTLPGGTIVLLDGLVHETTSSDQVLAVLGHELGHVAHRHTLRRIAELIGLGAVAQLLWGEISSIVAQVPLIIGILSYSREDEHEADVFAVEFLAKSGLSAEPLYEFFAIVANLEAAHGGNVPRFLSTHPPTPKRLEWLRQQLPAAKLDKQQRAEF